MNWTQLKVTCASGDLEKTAAVMSMLDSGLMIEDYRDLEECGANSVYGELIDESLLNADKTKASVSLYVPEEKNHNEYVIFLKERFDDLGIEYEYELIGLAEEDWANSWKQYYKPVKIGKRLVIVPEWEEYIPDGSKNGADKEILIYMDPGMAFGTGTHETTRLCAELIEKYMPRGANVLDIGTGSGILAVAAAKLGAASIFACDVDPVAVRVAKENALLNGVDNMECRVSDLLKNVEIKNGLYDFVSVNIVADIITRMADSVGNFMKEDSLIVISGIIDTQTERIKSVMSENGFVLIDFAEENDWVAFVFKHNHKILQNNI